jgi:cytochrome c oxidase assembly protein Cox11
MKLVKDFFALVGAVATTMFILGYAYASVPLPRTCTPTVMDRILK